MRELSVLGVPSWGATKDKQMQNAKYLFIDSNSFLSSNDACFVLSLSVCDRIMGNLNTVSLPSVSSVTSIWH